MKKEGELDLNVIKEPLKERYFLNLFIFFHVTVAAFNYAAVLLAYC